MPASTASIMAAMLAAIASPLARLMLANTKPGGNRVLWNGSLRKVDRLTIFCGVALANVRRGGNLGSFGALRTACCGATLLGVGAGTLARFAPGDRKNRLGARDVGRRVLQRAEVKHFRTARDANLERSKPLTAFVHHWNATAIFPNQVDFVFGSCWQNQLKSAVFNEGLRKHRARFINGLHANWSILPRSKSAGNGLRGSAGSTTTEGRCQNEKYANCHSLSPAELRIHETRNRSE